MVASEKQICSAVTFSTSALCELPLIDPLSGSAAVGAALTNVPFCNPGNVAEVFMVFVGHTHLADLSLTLNYLFRWIRNLEVGPVR